jgi:hypothetical protein
MHNEQSSAQTSHDEPQHNIELSEADYLAREVVDARSALLHALADLKSSAASSTDMRKWVQHYPWAAVGAAVAAGFAAAAAVTPAPGESISDKLARSRPAGHDCSSDHPAGTRPKEEARDIPNIVDKLLSSLFDMAKILVQTLIVSAFQCSSTSETPATDSEELRVTRVAK